MMFEDILINFPRFELSYDIIIHKKVYDADVILAIPEGHKFFAWFTIYRNEQTCFLIEINNNKIINVKSILTNFADKLVSGTIFYGTLFTHKTQYFCIEDIYYFEGKHVGHYYYLDKLEILKDVFKNELSQFPLTNKHVVFGLPFMTNDIHLMIKEIPRLDYKIKEIKFRYFTNKKILVMKNDVVKLDERIDERIDKRIDKRIDERIDERIDNRNKAIAIFKVTADIDPDIYNLFALKNKDGMEEYYDIAFIPTYKLSVMMNKLFRIIKENDNLDAIEESDDEEEFEDKREDKYVYLDKSVLMKCEYNYKFKRWTPIEVANKNDKIVLWTALKKFHR
jgi:hypothetical protein